MHQRRCRETGELFEVHQTIPIGIKFTERANLKERILVQINVLPSAWEWPLKGTLAIQLDQMGYNKKSTYLSISAFIKKGGDILSHKIAVPSALTGLTSLFGMGRGEPRCYNHLNSLSRHQILFRTDSTSNKLTYLENKNKEDMSKGHLMR